MDDLHELQTFRAGLLLPGFQSLFTGCLAGGFGAAVANLAAWPVIETGVIVGLAGALLTWWDTQNRWAGAVRYVLAGPDPDLLQLEPGPDPEPAQLVRVELKDDRTTQLIDLPASPAQLDSLAAGILAGKGLTVAGWVGIGKPFTRGQFETLRDVLINRNLARWINGSKAAGCELTPAGRAVIRRLAGV